MQVSWRSEQTRSTSYPPRLPVLTTHTVLPGPVNLWSLFPRTYFFLPGAFSRKSVFRRNQGAPLRVDLNPLPVLFSEKDFKSNFRLSGNFVPVGQFFSGQPLNFLQIGSRKWGVGVKWKLLGRLGKMAARSDAARQAPPGHPGLQHTSFRPPSDAIPPRYCRDSALPPYFREHTSRNRMAEHYHGSSGAGLRPKVVEAEYVEALGVLVVSAARHRSWQPSSPNGPPLTTSPPHPTSVNLSAKHLGVGRKKIARPVRNFPKGENWI